MTLLRSTIIVYLFILIAFSACDQVAGTVNAIKKDQNDNPNYVCDFISNKIHSVGFMMKINSPDAEAIKTQTLDSYATNNYELLWQDENGSKHSSQIPVLINALKNSESKGINSDAFPIAMMDTLFNQIYTQKKFTDEQLILNKIELDLMLTSSALSYINGQKAGSSFKHNWDYPEKKATASGGSLVDAIKSNNFEKALATKEEATPARFIGFQALKEKLAAYKSIQSSGGLPKATAKGLKKGEANEASTNLAKRLALTGDYKGTVTGQVAFDDKLELAIKGFQERYELKPTGKPDSKMLEKLNTPIEEIIPKIELNLERMRWLPNDLGNKYVFVNVPQFWVSVVEADKEVLGTRSIVGDVKKKTPMFTVPMTHLVFSPIWNLPQSIARAEVLKWLNINPGLLYVGDIMVYHKGERIKDPYSVDWVKAKENWRDYSFKQKPTNQNSLGDVKFMFPNKYAVYLHDTPDKQYFNISYRSMSSGCVRVQKPAEMAEILLDNPEWDIPRIKSAMNRSSERRVNLKSDVPVYIYYLTAKVDTEGRLYLWNDLYGHDKKQLKLMKG